MRNDAGSLAVPPGFLTPRAPTVEAPDAPRSAAAEGYIPGERAVEFKRMQLLLGGVDAALAATVAVAALVIDRPFFVLVPLLWIVLMVIRTTRSGRLADLSDTRPYVKLNADLIFGTVVLAAVLSDLGGVRTGLVVSTGLAVLGLGSRLLLGQPRFREKLDLQAAESMVVVGNIESVSRTIGEWEDLPYVDIIGVCLAEGDSGPESVRGIPVLGSVSDIASLARRVDVDVIAIHDVDQLGGLQLAKLQWALEDVGTQVSVITPMTNTVVGRARVRRLGRRLIVDIAYSRPQGIVAMLKGLIDRAIGLAALLAALPAMAVCAVFIKTTSPGPVIFKQTRVREHGRTFTMYKLRTMTVDAEDRLAELMELNEVGGGLFKMKADPRITKAGVWMRRLSLDELPQLWNVVIGDMSLIGPRPALPHEVASYDQAARRRLAVKPGLTGLWQVSGRSNLSWDESVRIDSDYVDNWHPGRDLSIALRTVKAVLRKDGAH